jgi:membrane protease YdiL (CAAX protease family)
LIFFNAGVLSVQELVVPESIFDYMNSITEDYNDSLSSLLSPNMPIWYVTLIVAVIPAIVEEILYRGYLQSKLNMISLPLGFVIIGLIFSLFHFNPISFIGLFFISVYLSFIRYATGSIIPTMVVHFMNNFIMILLYYNVNDAFLMSDNDTVSETDMASVLLILVLGLMILLFNSFALYKYKKVITNHS